MLQCYYQVYSIIIFSLPIMSQYLPVSIVIVTDGIPNDGIPIEEVVTVAVPLTVVYVILAVAGLVFTAVCMIFTVVFRKKK